MSKINELSHATALVWSNRGVYSLSSMTSYQQISRNLEAMRCGFSVVQLLSNLIDVSAAGPAPVQFQKDTNISKTQSNSFDT